MYQVFTKNGLVKVATKEEARELALQVASIKPSAKIVEKWKKA